MLRFGLAVLSILLVSPAYSQVEEHNNFSNPDVSSQGISFIYDGNIWLTSLDGGLSHQLTNSDEAVISARFSLDGNKLAYQKKNHGNDDVYTIATDGGPEQQLSYHPEYDGVVDWHPDGKRILIKSMRHSFRPRFNQFFLIDAKGGLAEPLPMPYAETGSYCSDGRDLVYTETNDFQDGNETWKRYKGGRSPDIWIFNTDTETAKKITSYDGIDTSPMCVGRRIYFLSDRGDNKRSNIWAYDRDSEEFEQITNFNEHDVRHPSSGNGMIVFENGGSLYRLSGDSKKLTKIPVLLRNQQRHMGSQSLALEPNILSASLSRKGDKLMLSARGDIFSYDIDSEILKRLSQTTAAERFPRMSAQGVLATMTDGTDEYQLQLQKSNSGNKTMTEYGPGFRFPPYWSPDGRSVVFADEKQSIHVLDTKSGKDIVIGQSQWKTYFALMEMKFSWSPDSQWLTFTMAKESRNQAVFLYSLKAKKLHQITAAFDNDSEAVFCGSGAFICVLSNRNYHAVHGDVDSTWVYKKASGLHLIPLKTSTPSPFSRPANAAKPDWSWQGIDLDGLEARMVTAAVKPGGLKSIFAHDNKLVFQRRLETGVAVNVLDLDTGEEIQFAADADILDVANNGRVLLKSYKDKKYQFVDLEKPSEIKSALLADKKINVDLSAEKSQVLRDAWRFYRDFYYDPKLHGRDWSSEWQRYQSILSSAQSSKDLNRLIREMGGELEGGHVWATETAARVRWRNTSVGLLGVNFEQHDGAYRIAEVLKAAPWRVATRSALTAPGLPSMEGQYLIAINGQPLDIGTSPWRALQGTPGSWIELEIASNAEGKRSQKLMVKTLSSERELRELSWVERNRQKVEKQSGGRVGYIYVADTSRRGTDGLMREYQGQYHKEALIIDARFNSGGALGDRLIELLNRPVLNYFSTRNAADSQLPELGNSGAKILMTNGWSYSGGDGFPFLFQQANIGPVLGTRTWGGLIGPSQPIPLINGGAVSPAPQRVYDVNGQWGTGGSIGVTPDIVVENTPNEYIDGVDQQLNKALSWTMKQLQGKAEVAAPIPR